MPRNRLMRVMNNGPEAPQSPTGLLYNYSSFNTAKEFAWLKLLSTRGGAKSGKSDGFILKRQFTINVKQQKARSAHARVKKLLVLKVN